MPRLLAKTLHDQRRSLLGWSLGLLSLVVLILLYYPTVRSSPELDRFFRNLPSGVRAFIGRSGDFTSPAGYLSGELFSLMLPLLFLTYGISAGYRAIAGEEERKTIDLLLANPLSRTRMVLEKIGAAALGCCLLGLIVLVALLAGQAPAGLHIGAWKLLAAVVGLVLLGILFAALALALGSAAGRRLPTRGLAVALATIAYLLDTLAPLVSSMAAYQKYSPFYWYSGGEPLRHGFSAAHCGLLLGATALLVALATVLFNRRDITV